MKGAALIALALVAGQFIAKDRLTGTTTATSSYFTGTTRTAATCSKADIEAKIALSSDRDIVSVPAGSCTWAGRIHIDNISIKVMGAGVGSTIIAAAAGDAAGFTLTNAGSRITGFEFTNVNACDGCYNFVIEGSANFRVDHNKMTWATARDMFVAYGQGGRPVSGLVDNNTITYGRFILHGSATSGFLEDGGNNRWSEADRIGTANTIFLEDNTDTYTSGASGGGLNQVDGNYGCHYVVRFNTLVNTRIEAHGLQGDDSRGCKSWEIYNNTITNSGTPGVRPMLLRGGTGLVFHNTTDNGFSLTNDINIDTPRSSECSIGPDTATCSGEQNQIPKFKFCNGNNYPDGNTSGQQGYPCRDQIGTSTDAFLWTSSGGSYSSVSVPTQTLRPAYLWKNLKSGAEMAVALNTEDGLDPETGTSLATRQSTYHILQNRNFYTYASSFDGTVGVGEGVLASRPATCTTGVAYWVTDRGSWRTALSANASGRLDVCTATNTWSDGYYTPYPYPHPFQSTR